jgi:streptogramin lyase
MAIHPSTTAVATISLGEPGDDPVCSMCVENVVFEYGSAWTANNAGRSVSRVDPSTDQATEIPVELRVWVASADDSIWGSQVEPLDGSHIDLEAGGLMRIDPETESVISYSVPGTVGVATGHESLWMTVGRRADVVFRYGIP